MKDEQKHNNRLIFCVFNIEAIAADATLEDTMNIIRYNNQQGTTYMVVQTSEYVKRSKQC